MEDSDSLQDIDDLDQNKIDITFDDLKTQLTQQPQLIQKQPNLCRALYHYCKDQTKHGKIIRYLFFPIIMTLIQDSTNSKLQIFGFKAFNQLVSCEASLAAVIAACKATKIQTKNKNIEKMINFVGKFKEDGQDINQLLSSLVKKDGAEGDEREKQLFKEENLKILNEFIQQRENPQDTLMKILKETNSEQILQQCSKSIRIMAQAPDFIFALFDEYNYLQIVEDRFLTADPISQENMIEIISLSCEYEKYLKILVQNSKILELLIVTVQSVSLKISYFAIKILQNLSKDKFNFEALQVDNLRLTQTLINAFQWLELKQNSIVDNKMIQAKINETQAKQDMSQVLDDQSQHSNEDVKEIKNEQTQNEDIYNLIYIEISECFKNLLTYMETHERLLDQAKQNSKIDAQSFENEMVSTLIKLGRKKIDKDTYINASKCISYISEVLPCSPIVASQDVIVFMLESLQDKQNANFSSQGCKYFANLSFYKEYRESLIKSNIGSRILDMLDGQIDDDIIKHCSLALANLSSHKGFFEIKINGEVGSTENWNMKPLFQLINSENPKINIIQSACITLCNISSKPQLHNNFHGEQEITALKNCLTNPCDKEKENDLVRFVIKIVLNLTKNVENHDILAKNGFLEALFELLDYEKQKDIFGNVVMAVSYLCLQKACLEKFLKENIFPRILNHLTMIHEIDQKMIMIAITSMLFNGIEIQREFIRYDGLGKLLFFMQQQDKIFQQLACKSFSLLSENQENLQDIIDQDCLNTVIVSSLKTKEIDLETIKEIIKIFINLILWRKISKETFETTCCLCDIGLLIDDYDVNILAIFCLNSLSENEETHQFIRSSGTNIKQNESEVAQVLGNTKQSAEATKGSVDTGKLPQYNSQSVFNQINYLLELYQNKNNKKSEDQEKQGLIITLITSFYLNLARNPENVHFLLQLQIFKKLNSLMKSFSYQSNIENTALCYTNTIFSKLLKNPISVQYCIDEEGYELLISILKGQQPNKHLFQETLDSIKVFLSDRQYLTRFKEIPDYFQIDTEYPDLNLSYLQILAVLSFEKENHSRFKSESFIRALKKGGHQSIFNIIFSQIESNNEDKKQLDQSVLQEGVQGQSPQKSLKSVEKKEKSLSPRNRQHDSQGGGAAGGNFNKHQIKGKGKLISRRNRIRENQQSNNIEEITLAISIIFANLSSDYEFIRMLLEVDQWNFAQKQPLMQINFNKNILDQAGSKIDEQKDDDNENQDPDNGQNYRSIFQKQQNFQNLKIDNPYNSQKNFAYKYPEFVEYDDEILKNQESVVLITKIFDLLSHDNIYISEQIIILLVNISNSPFFRKIFVSDLCIKSLLRILKDFNNESVPRVSQLAALIIILNLSSKCDEISTFENINMISTLQDIIKDELQPNLNKSIVLLIISNVQIISNKISTNINQSTKDFAFQVLLNWRKILDEKLESAEVVKNLVYGSLVLFYNLILKKVCSGDLTTHLINVIADRMLAFQDEQIVNVLLELMILFTREKENSDYMLQKQLILDYVFEKVQSKNLNQETFRLANLSLSRLAARINDENSNIFIQILKQIRYKDIVDIINEQLKSIQIQIENQNFENTDGQISSHNSSQNESQKVKEYNQEIQQEIKNTGRDEEEHNLPLSVQKNQMDQTLKYFLSFLENITSLKKIREMVDSIQLIKDVIDLYTDYIGAPSKISIINVLFNLNFSLKQSMLLEKEFLKKIYRTYIDELKSEENTKRKIITIVVSASALDQNHKNIIKSGFYSLFKKNITEKYDQLVETDEEVELFGLINIVLNQNCIHLIYQDLKKIHKFALKNNKVEFKTKVDLLIECRKYLSGISSLNNEQQEFSKSISKNFQSESSELLSENQSEREPIHDSQNLNVKKMHQVLEKNKNQIIDCCLKALIFSIIKLIGLLDTNDFSMFKYLLNAINDCSQNLQSHLTYLIKIENLIEFLKRVLFESFKFDMKEYDDQVLNFSLKNIVCEIFYHLMQEKQFLKLKNISETIKLLIKFSQSIIEMNVEKKMYLVSKTIRLVSNLLPDIQSQPEFQSSDIKKCFVEFIRDALVLSKDLQPCVNIDAIYCLINMMEIQELAVHESILNIETINNVMVIYFAYNKIIELDECVVTYLYLISLHQEYHQFIHQKHKVLYYLMEKQIDPKSAVSNDQSRQKIFSLFHNLSENEEICQQIDAKKFINLSVKMLQQTSMNKISADYIHELSLKSIINMTKFKNEQIDEADLQSFFVVISKIYPRLKNLPKQYAIRLITIFIKQWKEDKLQEFLSEILNILSQFIEYCDSVTELKFIIMDLEKIASIKPLMKSLSDKTEDCKQLLKTIHNFIDRNFQNAEQHPQIEQLLRFCKKLSKQPRAQQYLVDESIHETALEYISQNLSFSKINKKSNDDNSLKQILVTIQNIMKMIKNIYDGNVSKEQQNAIFLQVTKRENIINDSDQLLKNCKNSESKDELAIIIVNIILCYNSISKKLDANRVRSWIQTFSERLISASQNSFNRDEQARSWYLEKYVLIIELLVTKNLDKIDKNVTFHLMKIYEVNDCTKYFTNAIWYKLIKILAHIQNIQDITHKSYIENIMTFIMVAYEKTNEILCFFYFMKIVLLILKKNDCNALIQQDYKQFLEVLRKCFQFLKINKDNKTDPLTLEILLYIIDMINYLMKFHLLHEKLNKFDILVEIIHMIKVHENPLIMKSLTATVLESSKISIFYTDLLKDQTLNILIYKILTYSVEPYSLSNIYESLRNIIQQTKSPIKYLIATSILKITEENSIDWKSCNENNLFFLLKILCQNIQFLTDDGDDTESKNQNNISDKQKEESNVAEVNQVKSNKQNYKLENLEELQRKALKYSVMAITNILIQQDKDLIFNNKISVLSILQPNCSFEIDPQMNLRLLYLLYVQLEKTHLKSQIKNKNPQLLNTQAREIQSKKDVQRPKSSIQTTTQKEEEKKVEAVQKQENIEENQAQVEVVNENLPQQDIQSIDTIDLVNFLIDNITKYKNVILLQDAHHKYEIPQTKQYSEQSQNPFFFEEQEFELSKITAIRLSLSFSVQILYHLTIQKKKIACQAILDNPNCVNIFQYFIPYVLHAERSGFKQIKQIINIIQNCSDNNLLHQNLFEIDCITHFTKLYEKVIKDEFEYLNQEKENKQPIKQYNFKQGPSQQVNILKKSIILKIFKIFMNLSMTEQFFWHFNSDISSNFIRLGNEIEDEEIKQASTNLSLAILESKQQSKTNNNDQSQIIMDIMSLKDQQNLDQGAITIMNIEKLLKNKKIKLEMIGEDEFMSMMVHLEKILIFHGEELNRRNFSIEEETNAKKRRVIIKSTLEIISFIYNKKYMADMKSGYSKQDGKKKSQVCAIEQTRSLKILKEYLFTAIKKAQNLENKHNNEKNKTPTMMSSKGRPSPQVQLDGVVSFPDFREISDIPVKIFCSLAISPNFGLEEITEYILPIGQLALNHTMYSLDKTLSSFKNTSSIKSESEKDFKIHMKQIQETFSIQYILEIVNSIVSLLKNSEQNILILQKFDLALLINTILDFIVIYEQLSNEDQQINEQYETYIKQINVNLELIIKNIYFCPIELMPSSINLIHKLLTQQKYRKSAFFAIYCVALMIQDIQSQKECIQNLIPVFNDKIILKELFEAVKIVDQKYKEHEIIKLKNLQLTTKDMLDKYEFQTKNSIINHTKKIQQETAAKIEFEQALAIRISCLQILVIIVEFLSNIMIKNEQVIIEAKSKEVKALGLSKQNSLIKSNDINQVILTTISAKQHEQLTQNIYVDFDLINLVINQIVGRIPLNSNQSGISGQEKDNEDFDFIYTPSSDEINIGARIFASTPFSILKKMNPNIEQTQSQDEVFSIQLYFKSLSNLISYSQSIEANKQLQNANKNQVYQLKTSYFALFALLDFVIHLPLYPKQKQLKTPVQSPPGISSVNSINLQNTSKLEKMTYNIMMELLQETGLLQNVIKLPNSIEVSCPEDESLIRMCMKLLISIMFKGQQLNSQNFFNFNSDVQTKEKYINIFYQSGIQDPKEIYQIMSQCSQMVQKLYNFEISQIYQESYVQYLHLLSQLTVNSIQLQDQIGSAQAYNSNFSFSIISNFLIENIYDIAEQYVREDQKMKLQTSDMNKLRNIIYQYFFINYLISISATDIIKESQKCNGTQTGNQVKSISVSQGIFIILINMLDSLSDYEFNDQLDQIIQSRIQTFEKFHDHQKTYENMEQSQQSVQYKKQQKQDPSSPSKNVRVIPQNSASMTILKMILFNLDKLFKVAKHVQDTYQQSKVSQDQNDMTHKMQLITIDEKQLDLLVQLLVQNEQYGEIVNKVYEILSNLLEISKFSNQAYKNVGVIDMSKSLLQICIKHSSIYQCESAFNFLSKLVNISDKYQNKQDIEYSLSKILPASMHNSQSRGTKRISKKTGSQIGNDSQDDNLKAQSQLSQYQQ